MLSYISHVALGLDQKNGKNVLKKNTIAVTRMQTQFKKIFSTLLICKNINFVYNYLLILCIN